MVNSTAQSCFAMHRELGLGVDTLQRRVLHSTSTLNSNAPVDIVSKNETRGPLESFCNAFSFQD